LFPQDAVFPVVSSDLHPLKLHSRGLLARGIMSAVVLHFLVFGTWIVQRALQSDSVISISIPRLDDRKPMTILPPPPPIAPEAAESQMEAAAQPVLPDATGVPEVVPDFMAPDVSYQTPEEWVDSQTTFTDRDGAESLGPIFIDTRTIEDEEPAVGTFVAYEEAPVAIQNPAPVYPEMARAAEVEGTVVLLVLVNKEGRVAKAQVVSGHPMLDEAALAAVRNWVFRPAMQQHRPVTVWVRQAIRFSLR